MKPITATNWISFAYVYDSYEDGFGNRYVAIGQFHI